MITGQQRRRFGELGLARIAEGKAPNLWALDIDPRTKQPYRAHLIIDIDIANGDESRISRCGTPFTERYHREGWWTSATGEFPLALYAIHCGHELIYAQRPIKPFYRFVTRKPAYEPGLSPRLIWRNEHEPHDTVETSEWAFWRLWRYDPLNAAHPLSIYHHTPLQTHPDL